MSRDRDRYKSRYNERDRVSFWFIYCDAREAINRPGSMHSPSALRQRCCPVHVPSLGYSASGRMVVCWMYTDWCLAHVILDVGQHRTRSQCLGVTCNSQCSPHETPCAW